MSNNDILQKVIDTTDVGSGFGGILSAEQSNRFIDYMFDATVLGKLVRTVRMRAPEVDIDKIGVGERLVRAAVEAVDTGENAGATFTKVTLTTKKVRLDWELSTETLEDSLEGDDLEDHIARLMATQMGNDLEDIAINGDTGSADPSLKAFDGWRKRADAGAVDATAVAADGHLDRGTFNAALKAMPRKFKKNRAGLRFFTSSNAIQDYLFGQQLVSTDYVTPEAAASTGLVSPVSPEGPAGFNAGRPFGVPLVEVPLFDERGTAPNGTTDLWLTFPQNLLWGVKREITVHREFKPKKDTIEYTVYARVGTQIENLDAFVFVDDVPMND